MPVTQPQNENRLLRTKEFAQRLGVSIATVYRLVAAGQLPPPVKIGAASAWPSSDVDALIARRSVSAQS